MRLRFTVLATALAAFVIAAIPSLASAAPHHNRGLTIHAVPPSINAGDEVDIIGRLTGPGAGGQTVRLWHRINPNGHFTPLGTRTTDSAGRYEFTRADGIVDSNRSWFVAGPGATHSKVVHERVAALVSIDPDPASGGVVPAETRQPVTFSGHVTPDHSGQIVKLQVSLDQGDNWRTIKTDPLGAGSNYSIAEAWRTDGPREVRVILPPDARNTRGISDTVTVQVQQRQVTGFSIQSSDQLIPYNSQAKISGVVDQPGGSTPDPSAIVSLYAHMPHGGPYKVVQTTTTGSDGGYTFTVQPSTNEWYVAKLTFTPRIHSAALFQGVQDLVSMTGPSSATVDQHVDFTGTVTPDKSGHVIYLQKLGADNQWNTVEVRTVSSASTFSFGWTFGAAGTKQFRARILGGPVDIGGASSPVSVTVTDPSLGSLPTG
jgi:hypothetical protein